MGSEPTWDEIDQLEDDWQEDYCPCCNERLDACVCDPDDDEFFYTDEDPTENQYNPHRNLWEWLYYTYRWVYFRLPAWLQRVFGQVERLLGWWE